MEIIQKNYSTLFFHRTKPRENFEFFAAESVEGESSTDVNGRAFVSRLLRKLHSLRQHDEHEASKRNWRNQYARAGREVENNSTQFSPISSETFFIFSTTSTRESKTFLFSICPRLCFPFSSSGVLARSCRKLCEEFFPTENGILYCKFSSSAIHRLQ